MADPIADIINRSDTWRGMGSQDNVLALRTSANSDWHGVDVLPTGFTTLDTPIALGGWPLRGGVEVLSEGKSAASMGIFLPTMVTLSEQRRWQAFIAAPHTPYAPLLAKHGVATEQILMVHPKDRDELLWATEQALRSTTCSVVFSWLGAADYRYAELRKLQLAAAENDTLAVIFRDISTAEQHTPFSLRLAVNSYNNLTILKQRGGRPSGAIQLPDNDNLVDQLSPWNTVAEAIPTRTGRFLTPVA